MPLRSRRLFPAALLAAVLGPGPVAASPQDPAPRRVAFLVAVGKYDHNFSDLSPAPLNDVTELAKALGGFEVVTLTGAKSGRDRATKANVEGRFKELLAGGNGKPAVRDGDTVLVVLCGHGVQAEALDPAVGRKTEQPFFCPVDARPDDTGTMVPLNGLIRASEAFGGTTLFLVDACREVTDPNRGTRSGIQGKKVTLPPKTAVLFACAAGQLSHQSDRAGPGHGLFTFAVLKSLRGGGAVSWGRLVDDVQAAFQSDEFKALLPPGKRQTPVLATGELGFTELVAARAGGKAEPKAKAGGAGAKKDDPPAAKDGAVRIKTQVRGYLDAAMTEDSPNHKVLRVGTTATVLERDATWRSVRLRFADGTRAWVEQECTEPAK